jgi:hypothetical protein
VFVQSFQPPSFSYNSLFLGLDNLKVNKTWDNFIGSK